MKRGDHLTPDMCTALRLLSVGQSPYLGTSGRQRQARGGTMAGLVRRGLVCRCSLGLYWLTEAGMARVAVLQ